MVLGRGFARLWAGNALGNLSDGLAFVVILLLAVALTTDPLLVAGLPAAYSAVRLLTVVPVGVLVDRWDRRGSCVYLSNMVGARAAIQTSDRAMAYTANGGGRHGDEKRCSESAPARTR